MVIGQKIKELAKKKNVSVLEIAKKLRRSRQNIYAIFEGRQKVNTELLEEISLILGVSPLYFWSEEGYEMNEGQEKYGKENEATSLKREISLLEKLLIEKDEKFDLLKAENEELKRKLEKL